MARKAKTLTDYRKENAALRKQVADLEKRNGTLRYAHDDMERKLRHMTETNAKTAETLHATHDKLEAMINARDAADKTCATLRDEIDHHKRERSLIVAENDTLKGRLHAREDAYEKATRRADMNDAGQRALLEAIHRLGQGLGDK